MTFASPWLILLVLIPLFWVALRVIKWYRPQPKVFASTVSLLASDPKLRAPRWKRHATFSLWMMSLALLVIALARPQVPQQALANLEGIDIVLALDVSHSMTFLDASADRMIPLGSQLAFYRQPDPKIESRLTVAKSVLSRFVERRRNDQLGLVIFSDKALIWSPLTAAHEILEHRLSNLTRQRICELGFGGGTTTADALQASLELLRGSEAESKALILLTDGKDSRTSRSPLDLARELKQDHGIQLYIVGIGGEGEVMKTDPRQVCTVADDELDFRRSDGSDDHRLNERALEAMANVSNGMFFRANNRDELEQIYDEIDELETSTLTIGNETLVMGERFFIPMVLALALLLLDAVLRLTSLRSPGESFP